jgi:hypothetical protein
MALTAQQIVQLSTQTAHCTGFLAQAGQLLNVILADLADTQDLELEAAKVTLNLTTGGGQGPYPLPIGYRRASINGVYYTDSAGNHLVQGLSRDEFNALNPSATAGPPVQWWADLSPLSTQPAATAPNLFVWPEPDKSYSLVSNLYQVISDISAPETSSNIPWFPNQRYLITRLSAMLMDLVDDQRADAFTTRADALLAAYLMYANDDEGHVKTKTRDARRQAIGI